MKDYHEKSSAEASLNEFHEDALRHQQRAYCYGFFKKQLTKQKEDE